MAKFRLMGECGWIANSETDLGEYDFANEEEARDAAWEAVCERIESWVEVVPDDLARKESSDGL
jgi:hypothetical protein